ncbi:MAG: transcription-repair coupling factor [Bdellovibrionaceae bacterium]|nr:transcription-repair coupling factor [Pseudobdellovibrionaceae bacterium]
MSMVSFKFDSVLNSWLARKDFSHLCITTADPLFSAALALSTFQSTAKAGPHIVITKDPHEAEIFCEHFRLFSEHFSVSHKKIRTLPSHDISPYSGLYTSRKAQLEKISWLYHALNNPDENIFVAPLKALSQFTITPDDFLSSCTEYKRGDELPHEFADFLNSLGYQAVPMVEDAGSYAIRGGIVDIFSPAHDFPVRIELFGDIVESLRFFDANTQASIDSPLSSFVIAPAHEILFTDNSMLRACTLIDKQDSAHDTSSLKSMIRSSTYFDGIDFLLPYFYEKRALPTQFFLSSPLMWWLDAVDSEAHFLADISHLQEEFAQEPTHVPAPNILYSNIDAIKASSSRPSLSIERLLLSEGEEMAAVEFPSRKLAPSPAATLTERMDDLISRCHEWRKLGSRIFIFGVSEMQLKRLSPAFEKAQIPLKVFDVVNELTQSNSAVSFIQGRLSGGFHFLGENCVFVGSEYFLKKSDRRPTQVQEAMDQAQALSFSELNEGDPVVHVQHGVAIYVGLQVMNIGGVEAEFLELRFRDKEKLFLPIYRLNQVNKYLGAGSNPILDKLGGKQWEKTKTKVQTRLREVANELVQLYAKRQQIHRDPYAVDDESVHSFEDAFPYEETPDQLRAINDIKNDLLKDRPMDRLICGDVGFGKTEVAMRTAFIVASQKRQVAILAPTTILTLQHYETFQKRFKSWPLNIAVLNRFVANAEASEILQKTREGKIDILIGTHRLLSQDVQFKNLGLLVVDEEQKFGVKHKEKIRLLKNNVDTLAMSATPIPRTLNMSLLGIRDLSLINTPPVDRLPTRTFVSKFDFTTIKKSVDAEIKRGGQIFFLHNRVQSIYGLADELRSHLPGIRLGVAHGQMEEDALEKTMVSFLKKDLDLLLCTTIIESGVDIPSVNTIFIDQAQALGLSQLYQLRGRVGRGKQRAFCYLLVPRSGQLDTVAKERLRILQQNTALGSGIQIAQFDLELRGAGTLLGEEQSGSADAVGYELYMDLLEQAIHEARGEAVVPEIEPEINLRIKALIPHSYMPDIRVRLSYYKALSSIHSIDEVDRIERAVNDQFGHPPEEVLNLFGIMMIRHQCKELGIRDVSAGAQAISLAFTEQTRMPVQKIVELTALPNKKYALTPDNRLKVRMNAISWQNVFDELNYLLKFI